MDKIPNMGLTSLDWTKIRKDIIWFSSVPLLFYIAQILADLQTQGHVINIKDFIPSNATLIAIVTWVLNQVANLIRKYIA